MQRIAAINWPLIVGLMLSVVAWWVAITLAKGAVAALWR